MGKAKIQPAIPVSYTHLDVYKRQDYVRELEQLAQAADVADALAISAPTDAMRDAYAACDLVLQLSRKPEAFGLSLIHI